MLKEEWSKKYLKMVFNNRKQERKRKLKKLKK